MRVCRDGRGAAGDLGAGWVGGGRDPAPSALSLVLAASFSCFVRPEVFARFSFTACGARCSGSGGGAASAGRAGAGAIGGGLGEGIGATMGIEGLGAMAAGAGGDGAFAVRDFGRSKISARMGIATAAATIGVHFDLSRVRSADSGVINSLAVRDRVVGSGTDGLIVGAIAIGDSRFWSAFDGVDIPSTGAAVPAAAARKAREKALIVGNHCLCPWPALERQPFRRLRGDL